MSNNTVIVDVATLAVDIRFVVVLVHSCRYFHLHRLPPFLLW